MYRKMYRYRGNGTKTVTVHNPGCQCHLLGYFDITEPGLPYFKDLLI